MPKRQTDLMGRRFLVLSDFVFKNETETIDFLLRTKKEKKTSQ